MGFAKEYIRRYAYKDSFINDEISTDLEAIVVIPSFDEPNIWPTLNSLYKAKIPKNISIEVIIVVNSPENASSQTLKVNRETLKVIKEFNNVYQKKGLTFYALQAENLAKKFAGAGFARKIGMDEAVRRFEYLNKPNGLIINLDADSVVEKNYFEAIFESFNQYSNWVGANIYFEHPLIGNEFPENVYKLIYKYELHLRYYVQMLKLIQYPYSFHTLGSAFVVKALSYVKQNGMNRKRAGEDFYFLHKLTALGELGDILNTCVRPSARPSHRVPFGTGAFIQNNLSENEVFTYNPQSFLNLAPLIQNVDFYFNRELRADCLSDLNFAESLVQFLNENNFCDEMRRINRNSSDLLSFRKNFFQWYNGFKLVKYFNYSVKYYPKIKVEEAAKYLLHKFSFPSDNMLNSYRKMDRKELNFLFQ